MTWVGEEAVEKERQGDLVSWRQGAEKDTASVSPEYRLPEHTHSSQDNILMIFQLERKVFLYNLFDSENNAHYCFILLLEEY